MLPEKLFLLSLSLHLQPLLIEHHLLLCLVEPSNQGVGRRRGEVEKEGKEEAEEEKYEEEEEEEKSKHFSHSFNTNTHPRYGNKLNSVVHSIFV